MNGASEKRTTWVLFFSGAMILVGGGMVFAFLGGGTVHSTLLGNDRYLILTMIGAFILAAGIATMTGALLWGVFFGEKLSGSKKLFQMPNVRVIARFVENEIGEMLFSQYDIDFDNPKIKYLVKLQTSDNQVTEYRCSVEVWQQCGEGMMGTAIVQGGWLGGFQGYVGGAPDPSATPYVP